MSNHHMRYISSMSEDDAVAAPPPPPPPPPPPRDETSPLGPNAATPGVDNTNKQIPRPSVLRTNNRGTSKNSVAFSPVMDNMSNSQSSKALSPTPASIAAATAAAAAVTGANNNRTHKLAPSTSSRITLDSLVNSQFENEAETHILAALEAEEMDRENQSTGLLGEGIEGMEDYSDDDEDYHGGRPAGGQGGDDHTRSLTWNNNNFLGAVAMQNQLPQYQVGLDYSSRSVSSPASRSPQKRIEQHHRKYLSSSIKGSLPAGLDDAALLRVDARKVAGSLAMHLQSEHGEGGEDPFLEAIHDNPASADIGGDEDDDLHQSVRPHEAKPVKEEEKAHAPPADVNMMTDATEATDNMNFMAQRLRSMQKRRSSLKRSMSSSRRSSSSESGDAPESSGDKLIDALASVGNNANKSFFSKIKSEYTELIVPKLPKFQSNIFHTLLYLIFPCLAVAAMLFYMLDNPMVGDSGTSLSWWFLFLGVRQLLMFELTRVGEVFWVEILALRSKIFNIVVGPYVSLAFINSQGWPYILCVWPVLDFCFLFGDHAFPKHWLHWQVKLDLFNAANPVVGVTSNETYMRILLSSMFVGVASSVKRLVVAIYLGRRMVSHFGNELETLMAKMILIGEVANLARDIENKKSLFEGALSPGTDIDEDEKLVRFRELMIEENSSVEATPSPRSLQRKTLEVPKQQPPPPPTASLNPSPQEIRRKLMEGRAPLNSGGSTTKPSPGSTPKQSPGSVSQGASPGRKQNDPKGPSVDKTPPLRTSSSDQPVEGVNIQTSSTAKVALMYLLSEWEEPELNPGKKSKATVRDLVEFKKAVAYMDDRYLFSRAFGLAKTREMCVQSSQEVYDRLMLSAGDSPALPFSILSILAMDEDGEFVEAKIKSLIRLFRPDRQGNLSRLDFVKSVDTIYKQCRLLRASIANSAQIDCAFEKIINCFFYFFVVILAVTILGIQIWTVFLSLNTFFLGFSFLFGAAASNYFEGLLLIFVRRPYDIGDRIATSNPKTDTDPNGSSTWYVDKVSLFTTTVRSATTNEVATYSNGSLAILRIINANQSPKAIIAVLIKFGLETPFNKITVFRSAVENFIKARPREWIALAGFRATRVEADFGYVEYKIVAQHRESWQNIGPILQSKADLSSFCLEATKKLDMKYESPPMPVNLSTSDNFDLSGVFQGEDNVPRGNVVDRVQGGEKSEKSISAEDLQEVANLFEIRKKKK